MNVGERLLWSCYESGLPESQGPQPSPLSPKPSKRSDTTLTLDDFLHSTHQTEVEG
jgi:hypothetical protein